LSSRHEPLRLRLYKACMRRVNIMFTITEKGMAPPLDKRLVTVSEATDEQLAGQYFIRSTTNIMLYHQYTLQLRFYQHVEPVQVILEGIQLQ